MNSNQHNNPQENFQYFEDNLNDSSTAKTPLQKIELYKWRATEVKKFLSQDPQFTEKNVLSWYQGFDYLAKSIREVNKICINDNQYRQSLRDLDSIYEEIRIKFDLIIKKSPHLVQMIYEEQRQKLKQDDDQSLRNVSQCQYFDYYGQIYSKEDRQNEYKNYQLSSFSKEQYRTVIKKTITSFLNSQGGTIYLGVRDIDISVQGVDLSRKDMDDLKLKITDIRRQIEPDCNQLVNVDFIPIKKWGLFCKGKWIVRIKVQQGDLNTIYAYKSIESNNFSLESAFREDGSTQRFEVGKFLSEAKNVVIKGRQKAEQIKYADPDPESYLCETNEVQYKYKQYKKDIKQNQILNQQYDNQNHKNQAHNQNKPKQQQNQFQQQQKNFQYEKKQDIQQKKPQFNNQAPDQIQLQQQQNENLQLQIIQRDQQIQKYQQQQEQSDQLIKEYKNKFFNIQFQQQNSETQLKKLNEKDSKIKELEANNMYLNDKLNDLIIIKQQLESELEKYKSQQFGHLEIFQQLVESQNKTIKFSEQMQQYQKEIADLKQMLDKDGQNNQLKYNNGFYENQNDCNNMFHKMDDNKNNNQNQHNFEKSQNNKQLNSYQQQFNHSNNYEQSKNQQNQQNKVQKQNFSNDKQNYVYVQQKKQLNQQQYQQTIIQNQSQQTSQQQQNEICNSNNQQDENIFEQKQAYQNLLENIQNQHKDYSQMQKQNDKFMNNQNKPKKQKNKKSDFDEYEKKQRDDSFEKKDEMEVKDSKNNKKQDKGKQNKIKEEQLQIQDKVNQNQQQKNDEKIEEKKSLKKPKLNVNQESFYITQEEKEEDELNQAMRLSLKEQQKNEVVNDGKIKQPSPNNKQNEVEILKDENNIQEEEKDAIQQDKMKDYQYPNDLDFLTQEQYEKIPYSILISFCQEQNLEKGMQTIKELNMKDKYICKKGKERKIICIILNSKVSQKECLKKIMNLDYKKIEYLKIISKVDNEIKSIYFNSSNEEEAQKINPFVLISLDNVKKNSEDCVKKLFETKRIINSFNEYLVCSTEEIIVDITSDKIENIILEENVNGENIIGKTIGNCVIMKGVQNISKLQLELTLIFQDLFLFNSTKISQQNEYEIQIEFDNSIEAYLGYTYLQNKQSYLNQYFYKQSSQIEIERLFPIPCGF